MVPWAYPEYLEKLTNLVNGGYIPMSRIDDAVRRILRVKFSIGLFENSLADEKLPTTEFGSEVNSEGHKVLYYIHNLKTLLNKLLKGLKGKIYIIWTMCEIIKS